MKASRIHLSHLRTLRTLGRGALVGVALVAMASCQTLPAVVITGGETFDVRYDPQTTTTAAADARAQRQCGGPATFVSGETRFDGLAYRTYRCGGGS